MKNVLNRVTEIEHKLNGLYDFLFNEINNKVYFSEIGKNDYEMVGDYELNSIIRELKTMGVKKVLKSDLIETLNSSFVQRINPFADYFSTRHLGSWKEGDKDYIQALADTITVSDEVREYWGKSFKKWLVAAVACVIDPDVTNHQVLIFSGAQGIGKTTWMKNLVPNYLSEYYYGGSINLGNKDTEIQLSENFLINLDELDNLSKKNMSALKEIITKPSIKLRRPYGTVAETMPRRASFMGSINNLEFLTDLTGNRRFLCFHVLDINNNHGVNLKHVYCQALSLFKSGFQYWMDASDIKEIEQYNSEFKSVPLEQEILERYYEPCVDGEKPDLELQTEDLIKNLYNKSKLSNRLSPNKLGSILHKMNWPRKRVQGKRCWLLNEVKVTKE